MLFRSTSRGSFPNSSKKLSISDNYKPQIPLPVQTIEPPESSEFQLKDSVPTETHNTEYILKTTSDPSKTSLPHVKLKTTLSRQPLSLLVDTGSSVSLIKQSAIEIMPTLTSDKINLRGIDAADVATTTLGHFQLEIPTNTRTQNISYKFHVVKKINLTYDGIIGNDLLNDLVCTINYNTNTLKIQTLHIPLQFIQPVYTIPPRTETVIECSISNPQITEGVIADQNILDSILIAN